MLEQLKKGRLFGHPIHSMLVHFPSALFPISWLFEVLSLVMQNTCLACAGFYTMGAGIVLGVASAIIGAVDYAHLPGTHRAWNVASLHALLNVIWLTIFSIIFGLQCKNFPEIRFATWGEVIFSGSAVVGLIYSNFLGGELIFRYKLGVDE